MFLGMQDFDFTLLTSLLKSHHFCPNFASILPKFIQNPTNVPKKILLGDVSAPCIPSFYGTEHSPDEQN